VRPFPCTCTADLDLDGVDESYTPLVDAQNYMFCRLLQLWRTCGGLPKWEYFIPRNCIYIESGTTCESDGENTYSIFPLPHPHTIHPNVKSMMANRSAYCHIRKHGLWNNCKLLDLDLAGDSQVPHFPRDAIVIKTSWNTSVPGGADPDDYYHYDYDDGDGGPTSRQYLTAWHFTDKCIDKWVWCDLYMDTSKGGSGGCGGTDAYPAALSGLAMSEYHACVNVRDTDPDDVCGNEIFPECDNANCMDCHSSDGAAGFGGANSAWAGGLGDGSLGSDFLYSLTSGPAVPTGGLSAVNSACD
jgi:hypothetical protein